MELEFKQDWTANSKSTFSTLGSTSHSEQERQKFDYYATEPKALELLLKLETFSGNIWECCCGEGHLSGVLEKNGYSVRNTDLIDRGYKGTKVLDFLAIDNIELWGGDIITNPPYRYANDFILKALSLIKDGNKLAMFLPIRYLEGKARGIIFRNFPPKIIYVSSSRLSCAKNGDFNNCGHVAIIYAWFIWEKGYSGETILKWFN